MPPMPLITLRNAELAYGLHPLLDRADLSVDAGERVGLIGRNVSGKSSRLQALAGGIALDDGEVARQDGLHIVLVEQEPELPPAATLRESLIARGHIDRLHGERDRWRADARLTEFLHRLGVDPERTPDSASGGERKRSALAL